MEDRLPYQEDRSSQLLVTALLALVAAVVCGVAWGLVGKWTNHEYGIAAVVVGIVVGSVVGHFGRGAPVGQLRVVAAAGSLVGIALGKYLEVVLIGQLSLFSSIAWKIFDGSEGGLWNGWDVLWAAIAVLQAIRIAVRRSQHAPAHLRPTPVLEHKDLGVETPPSDPADKYR